MSPIALQLGGFTIRWYGVMAAAGFLAAYWLLMRNRRYVDFSEENVSGALFTAIIAGVIGARIFYVVQFFDHYRDNLWSIFRIDQGGLVFYGGFLLALPTLWLFCRIRRLDFVRMLDLCAPALALGHAFGRVGCFLNGCCYGAPSGGWPGVVYPVASIPGRHYPGEALHPVQLYETAINLILCFLLSRLLRRYGRGVVASTYLIGYGLMRFLDELLRGDNPRLWGWFTPAQLIGLGIIPVGVILLVFFVRQNRHAGKSEVHH